jgi:hypothetical protein
MITTSADIDKQTVFDHAGDLVQDQRQLPGIADPLQDQGQG